VPSTIRAVLVTDATSRLVISEVMPDPTKVLDAAGEWFEVYNAGDDAVDLQGTRIVSAAGATASESHTIASSVIVDPGEYVVLGNNTNTATNGGVPEVYSYGTSIALNNGSSTGAATEWLALRTAMGITLDSVAYAVKPPGGSPGSYVPPSGASRGVIDLAADNTIISGTNWITSVTAYGLGDKGTPGQPNIGGPAVTVTVRISWVTPGTTFRVTASAVDGSGKPSATNFTWSSNPTSIATVNTLSGVATGVSTGIATLTATASNGVAGTAPLFVVNPGDVASVSISVNDPAQVPAGFTKPAFPTTRTTENVTVAPQLVWSSSDEGIATVSDLGYITGVAPGKALIRATAPDGVYGEVPFTVIPADAPTSAVYRNHIEFGAPTDNTPDDELILTKRQYVESYNKNRGGPNWVSWDLNATQFSGVPRCDCFSADQTLPSDVYHVVDFDYRNGLYDRGHMVQSESRTTTDQENASTFLLTNILPQGAENNQGPWSKFENYLNDLARGTAGDPTKHEIYIIAGGRYGFNPGTLKGEGKVFIPDYTWKVAVIVPEGKGLADVHSTGDLKVIAVEMPNLISEGGPASSIGIRNNPWEQYQTKVDKIEAETGYDLLSALPDRIELLVESGDHPPVAVVGGPTTVVEGTSMSFDGTGSHDLDGDPLGYEWDFGDGTAGSGATPAHTYADNGTYSVTLTVTDPTGADDSQTRVVTVANAAPVVKTLTATPTVLSGETVFALATFSDAGVNDTPWIYDFDWGAGSTSSGPTNDQNSAVGSSRSFLAEGAYSVAFSVTDKDLATSARKTATFRVLRIPTTLGVNPERINIRGNGNGQVIVTVFGTSTIDASAILLESVRIGSTGIDTKGNDSFKSSVEDANNDGIPDLIVHFNRDDLIGDRQLTSRTTEFVLRATLNDGRQIEAHGAVNVGTKD
jgi:DNA/RNA endonuclease G (NUC1)/PKD repeat protein